MKLTGYEKKMKRAIDLYENLAINSKFRLVLNNCLCRLGKLGTNIL